MMTGDRLAPALAALLAWLALGTAAQAQAQLGTIELTGGAPGAEVWVNGELQGTLPQASQIQVPAGPAVIEIRAQGYPPIQRTVTVSAGGFVQEALGMVSVSGSVSVGANPQPQPQPQPQAQPVTGQPTAYQPMTREVETHPNWALFGIGAGVFGATWITTWAVALGTSGEGDVIGLSFVPVVGPFVLSGIVETTVDDYYLTYLLVADGIAQAAGLVLAIIGLVSQQTEMVAALDEGPRAPRLALRPLNVAGAEGLSVALTHF